MRLTETGVSTWSDTCRQLLHPLHGDGVCVEEWSLVGTGYLPIVQIGRIRKRDTAKTGPILQLGDRKSLQLGITRVEDHVSGVGLERECILCLWCEVGVTGGLRRQWGGVTGWRRGTG